MHRILQHIESWIPRIAEHEFFVTLAPEPRLDVAMSFAPPAAFWVFTFQDVLRINLDLATDERVKAILLQHQREDAGHEEWFLEDLERIFGTAPTNIRGVFALENLGVRAATFALVSEVFRVSDDRLRLVVIETLEQAAGFFFARVARSLVEAGHTTKLKYFGGMHMDAEGGHEIHEEDGGLSSIQLPEELVTEGLAIVDRMFGAFWQLADTMLLHRRAAAAR
jgi:hypothetical protein